MAKQKTGTSKKKPKNTGTVLSLVKGDGVHLRAKKISNGRASLFLDIRTPEGRKKDFLNLHYKVNPLNLEERLSKKAAIDKAKTIRRATEEKISSTINGTISRSYKKMDFIVYCKDFLKKYKNKDPRIVRYAIEKLEAFNLEENEGKTLLPHSITEEFLKSYKTYLDQRLNGETPYNYFTKMKQICKQATKDGMFQVNPSLEIKNSKTEGLKKDILFSNEITKLVPAYCPNKEVKRAFLFCLYTGFRWVDVKSLTWSHVYDDYVIKFQLKTKKQVSITLNGTAKKLLGKRGEEMEKVFSLPSHTSALNSLKVWSKNAGISKHITWHCSRHSFAVNLLEGGEVDIKTLIDLLGHSGFGHVHKYTRVVDTRKKLAVDSLQELDLDSI